MELPTHPFADLFPLASETDFLALAQDIRQHGQRDAITLYDNAILDGRNRYRACEISGLKPRFETFEGTEDEALAFAISKNLARRHLSEPQRAMIGARLACIGHGGDRRSDQAANLPVVSQAEAAARVNVSERSIRDARKVIRKVEAVTALTEVAAAVDNGKIAVSIAARIVDLPIGHQQTILTDAKPEMAIKKVLRQSKEQELAHRQSQLPVRKFGLIYADPEWSFKTYSENGMDRSADNHYPTSTTEEIMSRDISSIAADDCVLFLWATAPMLPDALRVMKSWGFQYKSNLVWVKDRMGTGYWFRNQHEILLVGTKGNIPAPAMGDQWSSIIEAGVGRHSEKPLDAYVLIEEYFPSLAKIELNARRRREGWEAWGNELPEPLDQSRND